VIHAAHDGVHVAEFAFDEAKRCGEVFKIGRHGNSFGETPFKVELACLARERWFATPPP